MSLGKIEIVFAEGFCLQSGINVAFKSQNGLARVLRREVRLPVMKAGRIQIRQLIADAHQFADLWRREPARDADQLLGILQKFRLGVACCGQRALVVERFGW